MSNNLFSIIPYQGRLLKFSGAESARAYYKTHYIDLLTGESHRHNILEWLDSLEFPILNQKYEKRMIHLFYELGFIFENLVDVILETELLALDIQYSKSENYKIKTNAKKVRLSLLEAPQFDDYLKKFNQGYQELSAGNCYQFNLTGEYRYSFLPGVSATDFIAALWSNIEVRGAYASATYIGFFDKLFLSNSPECLFQYAKGRLVTRPIKGTLKRASSEKKIIAKLWHELSHDKKSRAELYMITDLLRNDLCRIDLPQAIVTKKKAALLVPGLLHQYSEIQIDLGEHVTLKKVLEKIFPGGSITGAPKKRVMQILKKLEGRTRGFYCGSTILFSKQSIEASINIRSSEIDFKKNELSYQAGGGITLLSEAESEFREMTYKHNSFIDILTL